MGLGAQETSVYFTGTKKMRSLCNHTSVTVGLFFCEKVTSSILNLS